MARSRLVSVLDCYGDSFIGPLTLVDENIFSLTKYKGASAGVSFKLMLRINPNFSHSLCLGLEQSAIYVSSR